jgi:hypothetical protein
MSDFIAFLTVVEFSSQPARASERLDSVSLTACLVLAHPAGDSDEEELELSRHRVENL